MVTKKRKEKKHLLPQVSVETWDSTNASMNHSTDMPDDEFLEYLMGELKQDNRGLYTGICNLIVQYMEEEKDGDDNETSEFVRGFVNGVSLIYKCLYRQVQAEELERVCAV